LRNIKEVLKKLNKKYTNKLKIKQNIENEKSDQENTNNNDTLEIVLKDENKEADSIITKNAYSFKSYTKHCDWSTELKPNSSDIEVTQIQFIFKLYKINL
jgi:hypothetical protein